MQSAMSDHETLGEGRGGRQGVHQLQGKIHDDPRQRVVTIGDFIQIDKIGDDNRYRYRLVS
jgi:hypothetical protein